MCIRDRNEREFTRDGETDEGRDFFSTTQLTDKFEEDWAKEKTKPKPNLVRSLLVRHKVTFVWTGVLFGIAQASLFAGPLLLREIVGGIECAKFARMYGTTPEAAGCVEKSTMYRYAILLAAASILQNFCTAHAEFALQKVGISVRNSLMCALYRNCLLYTSPSPRDRTRSRMPSSA